MRNTGKTIRASQLETNNQFEAGVESKKTKKEVRLIETTEFVNELQEVNGNPSKSTTSYIPMMRDVINPWVLKVLMGGFTSGSRPRYCTTPPASHRCDFSIASRTPPA